VEGFRKAGSKFEMVQRNLVLVVQCIVDDTYFQAP
jgi:hypothetical protein